jgi:hypothetical protein
MPTPYFQVVPRSAVERFFNAPLDFIANRQSPLIDYREVLMKTCESRYTKAMLSPRWVLTDGKHNVYSTTVDQISDQAVREQILRGVSLAYHTHGDEFVYQVFQLFGSLIGTFLMAEAFYQIDVGFYRKMFLIADRDAEPTRPYDFKPFYLAVFIGQLELHYPFNFSSHMAPELCRRLKLDMEEVIQLSQRVAKTTGRPEMKFTFH